MLEPGASSDIEKKNLKRQLHPRPLGCCLGMRVVEEEAEHLARGVGPAGISVRSGRAPTRPGMAATMDKPLLKERLATGVGVQGTAIGMPAGYLTTLRPGLQASGCRRLRLRDDLVAIARVHRAVLVRVEHDGRDDPTAPVIRPAWCRGALAHGGEGGGNVAGSPTGKTGMDPDGGIEIGIGCPHDGRRRSASGQPGDVDACRV